MGFSIKRGSATVCCSAQTHCANAKSGIAVTVYAIKRDSFGTKSCYRSAALRDPQVKLDEMRWTARGALP